MSLLLRLYILVWLICLAMIGIAAALADKLPHAMFAFADCGYNAEIYISDWLHRTTPFRLSDNPFAWDWKPAWSPDGRQIVYQSDTDNQRAIYIVDLASGSRRPLASSIENAMSPSWSPDGRHIAFTHLVGVDTSPLFIADILSGTTREFAVKTSYVFAPVWSPDGQYIAFTDYESGIAEISILDVATGETRNISNHATAEDRDAAWSPDGKFLAFTSTRDAVAQLYIADVETGAIQNLSNNTTMRYSGFAWSPSGDHIAVTVNEREIQILDKAGNVTRIIAPPQIPDTIHAISWSSDGAYLAVASDPPGAYLVNIVGGTKYIVTASGCDFLPVIWAPQ